MSETNHRTPPSRRAAATEANEPIDILVDDLLPHPDQATVFPYVDEAEIAALAADIAEHGQERPVEVTPSYTIIDGHRRVEAARRNGRTTVRCIIRHDLATQGEAAIKQHFVSANLLRRQMSLLGKARAVLFLTELRVVESEGRSRRTAVKRGMGEMLGISVREVNRLLAALSSPPEVQTACEAGHVSLVVAGKVKDLSAMQRESIVAAIRAGRSPSAAITAAVREAQAAGVEDACNPGTNAEMEHDYLDAFSRLEVVTNDMARFAQVQSLPWRGSSGRITKLNEIGAMIGELIQREQEATRSISATARSRGATAVSE